VSTVIIVYLFFEDCVFVSQFPWPILCCWDGNPPACWLLKLENKLLVQTFFAFLFERKTLPALATPYVCRPLLASEATPILPEGPSLLPIFFSCDLFRFLKTFTTNCPIITSHLSTPSSSSRTTKRCCQPDPPPPFTWMPHRRGEAGVALPRSVYPSGLT
jgi:hypothetical protein